VILTPELTQAVEVIENLISCFRHKREWYYHKDNNGQLIEVSEDLHDYLLDAAEYLDSFREID